jgi:predicted Zn finger-like uncharacterized protein
MSLITSCPACGTMFRVVPDQLKISEGWVRCGHCGDVFDATAHLTDEGAPVPAAAPPAPAQPQVQAPTPATPPADPPLAPALAPTQPAPLASVPAWIETGPPPAMPVAPRYVEPDPDPGPDSEQLGPTSLDAPFVFRRSDLVDDEPVPSVLPPAPPPRPGSRFDADNKVQAGEMEDVSFVRHARRKAFWRRPMVRIGLAFASLLLAGVLLLQVAYHDRDRLAAAQPQLRPLLEQMCEPLRCTLAPPRQIDAVVIESSGFNRLRNDAYRLSFSVRNTAGMTVAAPAMELTLTDNQDQPVLRRVLTPADLGARDSVIAAGAEWSGSVGLVLNAGGNARIAGYRLLAFYP